MRNGYLFKLRVSEIRVIQICVNQEVGVTSYNTYWKKKLQFPKNNTDSGNMSVSCTFFTQTKRRKQSRYVGSSQWGELFSKGEFLKLHFYEKFILSLRYHGFNVSWTMNLYLKRRCIKTRILLPEEFHPIVELLQRNFSSSSSSSRRIRWENSSSSSSARQFFYLKEAFIHSNTLDTRSRRATSDSY